METNLSLGLPVWGAALFGASVGWTSEWSTRLALRNLLARRTVFVGPMVRWLALGFWVAKLAALWLLAYLMLSGLRLNLIGFAVGVLTYQFYRLSLMLFWPAVYLGQRNT